MTESHQNTTIRIDVTGVFVPAFCQAVSVSSIRRCPMLQRPSQTSAMFPDADPRQPGDLCARRGLDHSVLRSHGRCDAGPPLRCVWPVHPEVPVSAASRRTGSAPWDPSEAWSVSTTSPTAALRQFRIHYRDSTIIKDAIFDYVYGVLHAPGYRERFANDLAKELPRVPFAPFHTFATAGRELAALHLGYEHCDEHPLELVFAQPGEPPTGALPARNSARCGSPTTRRRS